MRKNSIFENIFSVKNENIHKVLTILGIKFKFINNKKFLNEIIQKQSIDFKKNIKKQSVDFKKDITAHTCDIKNNILKENSDIKNILSDYKKHFIELNKKYKKEFIVDNIDNPNYFNTELEIYNFFEEMKARKFYKIFQNRLSFSYIKRYLDITIKKFGKTAYILSDIKENIPVGYNFITLEEIKEHKNEDCIFVVVYNKDYAAIKATKLLVENNLKYCTLPLPFPLARYYHTDEDAFETLKEEQKSNNWHFCPVDFENIFQALNNSASLEGDYVEIGTFKGDSASAALNYMKRKEINKKAYFLDTFIGFDYQEAYDSQDAYWQNTHKDTSYENVKKRLEKYKNANVIKLNIISDNLPFEINKICVANIDVDMYEAVKAALYKVKDKIVQNGIIIAEDYGHTPGLIGAQKAVREFLEENPGLFIPIYMQSGQLMLIKK